MARGSPFVVALVGSAAVGGQFVAGKAVRDAFFLANFETSSLPLIVLVTAIFSIVLVVVSSRMLRNVTPGAWVPVAFAGIAVLIMVDWVLARWVPQLAARTLYFLVSGVGPIVSSGFWLIASDHFDPHTAKRVFGQIVGAGTLGGLLAGLGAARVAAIGGVVAMLPFVAALNFASAWLTRRLVQSRRNTPRRSGDEVTRSPARSGFRVLTETRYLRTLAALVLLGAIAATLVDQAFKTSVKTALENGPSLGRFFSFYYAALGLLTFVIQIGGSRYVLENLGLAIAAGAPAAAFVVGCAAALLAPGLGSMVMTRAGEAVFRGSIYRAGYEVFYTPIPRRNKRAVKSIIDVGIDRTGDIVGATITSQLLWIPQPVQTRVLLSVAMGCACVAIAIAGRLTRGYVSALEESLLSRAVDLDLSEIEDRTTRTAILGAVDKSATGEIANASPRTEIGALQELEVSTPARSDQDLQRIVALQSRDREAVRRVLSSNGGLSAAVVAYVIPLLAWNDVSDDCIRALRRVAEERIGELVDALADPNQPFVVRRRLARVFSVCVSQRAADGLLLGLEDLRFEVRYQSGRSLLAIVERNAAVRIEKARIFALVTKEVAVGRNVWEKRRLLDAVDEPGQSFLEKLVRDRASHALAHVFTLLALVLPTEPLRIAFRGLHTDDQSLRGTALEYLDSILPRDIRDQMWPFLEGRAVQASPRRPGEETLAALLRSSDSIKVNLEKQAERAEARRRALPDGV